MISDDYVRAKVAEFCWRQAHHISLSACLGVMFVIRTNAEHSGSGDWLSQIRGIPTPNIDPDPRDPSFKGVLDLVDSVYDGSRIDKLTNGATYFAGPGIPEYFDSSKLERVASIGQLVLWK